MLLFNILAVCLSIFMDRGEHQVLVNAQRQKGDGTSASVHQINHTVLLQQQSIIFNHIYNINVPLVSLCSVRAESALGRAESSPQEYAAEYFEQAQTMESQVGFTHNINIPQQACGCLRSSLLKNLMDRIELLEREVSMLRQECTSGYSAASLAAGRELSQNPNPCTNLQPHQQPPLANYICTTQTTSPPHYVTPPLDILQTSC